MDHKTKLFTYIPDEEIKMRRPLKAYSLVRKGNIVPVSFTRPSTCVRCVGQSKKGNILTVPDGANSFLISVQVLAA